MRGPKIQDTGGLRSAMSQLGWSSRDLWWASIQLSDVGREDVHEHLLTGNHLTQHQHLVLVTAADEALRDAGIGDHRLRLAP